MLVNFLQLRKGNHLLAVISGLSFALVPSKEDYFLSASGYNANAPKPHIFKVEPIPNEEIQQESGGVLSNVGEFVKSSIGKGVQAIKDLVSPAGKPSTSYGTPAKTPFLTSYGTPATPYSIGKKSRLL